MDGVARGDRVGGLGKRNGEREVPRRNHADDAERLVVELRALVQQVHLRVAKPFGREQLRCVSRQPDERIECREGAPS